MYLLPEEDLPGAQSEGRRRLQPEHHTAAVQRHPEPARHGPAGQRAAVQYGHPLLARAELHSVPDSREQYGATADRDDCRRRDAQVQGACHLERNDADREGEAEPRAVASGRDRRAVVPVSHESGQALHLCET